MEKTVLTNWNEITGAPSSGKTTLVTALQHKGHRVLHEAARIFIAAELEKGHSVHELRSDERAFQLGILEAKLQAEGALDTAELTFLDRAVPETYTYFKLAGIDPKELLSIGQTYGYKAVFVLDPLEFEDDGIRIESEEEVAFLDREFEVDYRLQGFEVVRVPVMPIPERVAFVMDWVRQFSGSATSV
jgi:predicted ATPase